MFFWLGYCFPTLFHLGGCDRYCGLRHVSGRAIRFRAGAYQPHRLDFALVGQDNGLTAQTAERADIHEVDVLLAGRKVEREASLLVGSWQFWTAAPDWGRAGP